VRRVGASSATVGIRKLPYFLQLLQCPRRPRYQPKGSHRRTTGGDTLQTAAALRMDVTSPERLTTRTLARQRSPLRDLIPRSRVQRQLLIVQRHNLGRVTASGSWGIHPLGAAAGWVSGPMRVAACAP
jgi:hypothetical protein